MTEIFRAPAVYLLAALALIALAAPAQAERADRDKPLQFEADHARYDDLQQVYQLDGHVVLTKGTMVLRGDAAEVRVDPEGYQHAIARAKPGNLVMLRQKRDGTPNGYIEGYGDTADYDGKTETAWLTGHAKLRRLEGSKMLDEIQGSKILYDSHNQTYAAQSGTNDSQDGRVRAVIIPQQRSTPASPKKK